MPSNRDFLGLVCAFFVACGSDSPPAEKSPNAAAVFPNLPVPPDAQFISRAGSADALQITMFSPNQTPQVTDYYRRVLTQGKWRLVSDVKKPDGTLVLYAEQDGPPIWVSIWPTTDGAGTMVQLSGAVIAKDSVKAEPSRAKPTPKKRS
jgi:hypothetical protein